MLAEAHCDLGISAYPASDKRLKYELVRSERIIAVASAPVAEKIVTGGDFKQLLSAENLLAYNLELPIIDRWLEKNKIALPDLNPAMIGQDLRSLRTLLCNNFGWTVLPEYLCASFISSGQLVEIPPPQGSTFLDYYLVWMPSALRQPRVAHARQSLLWSLKN